jgi:hypothetical protein
MLKKYVKRAISNTLVANSMQHVVVTYALAIMLLSWARIILHSADLNHRLLMITISSYHIFMVFFMLT